MTGGIGNRFVVDASVAIKLYLEEPLSETARTLFARLSGEEDIHAWTPDLFVVECANILWKHVRRSAVSPVEAEWFLLRILALELHTVASEETVAEALSLAMSYNISAYDASYVAVARLVDAPLVTADERLIRKVGESDIPIISLADLPVDS